MMTRLRDRSTDVQGKARPFLIAVACGLTVGIFTLDLLTPFGYVSWILYLIPLLLTLGMPQRAAPLLVAGSCTALIALGFLYFPTDIPATIALLNRLLGLLVIWSVAIFLMRHKEMQETLQEKKTQLQAILEYSPAMIFLKDRQGRYLLANREFEKITQVPCEKILGRTDGEIFPPAQAEAFCASDRTVLQAGVPMEFEEVALHNDGPHTSIVYKIPLRDSTGRVYAIGGIGTDITERKRAEQALRESEQQLCQLLDDRERLSQNLHDNVIQTLYAIGLGLEESQRLIEEDPKVAIRGLSNAVKALNAVIRDVRSYIAWSEPKISSGQQLKATIEKLARTMEGAHLLQFRLQVDQKAAGRLTPVEANHALDIMREAMSNSLRHSRAKTGVVLLQMLDGRVRLQVEDDGVGFDPQDKKAAGQGLHNIVARAQKLHADFQVTSRRGGGTRITVDIPKGETHASSGV
jgi:PAS domain S-box-containing protein